MGQDLSNSLLTDVAEAQRAILEKRGYLPNVLVANGAVLNNILGTKTYDPSKCYRVTADGVTEVVDR